MLVLHQEVHSGGREPRAVKRIAILSAAVGAGHLRAGQALEAAAQTLPCGVEARHWDVLELMPAHFGALYRDTYLEAVSKNPDVFGWIYQVTDRPFQVDPIRRFFEEAHAGRFFETLEEWKPDCVVCTHFLPADLLYARRKKLKHGPRIYTAVTDFDVHGMWLASPSDHMFVADAEARHYLMSLGLQDERISVTGIPTDPVFALSKDRAECAARHGLNPAMPTVLMSTGGFGTTPAVDLIQELARLPQPLQVIACCGRNARLLEQVKALGSPGTLRVVAQPFTPHMDELMTCADIILGKPGGLTTWESFQKGLAWVVVDPIPGQEERNTFHLLEAGAGVWAYQRRTLAFKVGQLLADPERLTRMRAASRALGRPQAAHEIMRWVADRP